MTKLMRRDGDREALDVYIGLALAGLLSNPSTGSDMQVRTMMGTDARVLVKEIARAAVRYAAETMEAREELLAGLEKKHQDDGPSATTGGSSP